MQGRKVRESSEQFGSRGVMFPSVFGEKDPFDDPFFTRPLFGSVNSNDGNEQQQFTTRSKAPLIQEIDAEDENKGDTNDDDDDGVNDANNNNPIVEHPEDQDIGHGKSTTSNSKELACTTNHSKAEGGGGGGGGAQSRTRSESFKRVTYGGINGTYYSATVSRSTGGDGVTLEESKQADKRTGQATHRVSRGIHDKGHSVTRKLDSDGKVDTLQTLHNLNEDELVGFDQVWQGSAGGQLHGFNDSFGFSGNAGVSGNGHGQLADWGGYVDPFREHLNRIRGQSSSRNFQPQSSRGRPKKTVTINIE